MLKNPAYLYVIAATVIWGATPAIMKLTLTQIPVFTLAFLRMFIASLIMLIFVRKNLKIEKKDYFSFINLALSGVTLNISLFFIGLKLTHAINAAFLVAIGPIVTIIAAHYYLKEKLEHKLITAGLIALFGATIIIGKPNGAPNLLASIGNILLLLSSLAWVLHELMAKKLLKTYDSSTVTFYTIFIGSLTFLPLFIIEVVKNPAWIDQINKTGFLGLLYGIFFASFIAYWSWQKGLQKLPAGKAAFFFYLDPISGALFSYLILGEKLTLSLIFGGLLIALAVILAEFHERKHPILRK